MTQLRLRTLCRLVRSTTAFASCAGALLGGCFEIDGGVNQNEEHAGNTEDGVEVGYGDIAIAPDGSYLLASSFTDVVRADLRTLETTSLPNTDGIWRLAFANDNRTVFFTQPIDGDGTAQRLFALDVETGERSWTHELPSFTDDAIFDFVLYPLLEPTSDGRQLIVTYPNRVEVRSVSDGTVVHERSFANGNRSENEVVDTDLSRDGKRLLITLAETWSEGRPETRIELVTIGSWKTTHVTVPNCADELTLSVDGKYAFLAPTTCAPEEAPDESYDPVSVIDLETNEFVRNLPGFGPVGLASKGEIAVAFLDPTNLDDSLFLKGDPKPERGDSRFQLMLIDTNDLSFVLVPVGNKLPRYAATPDGSLLLVDEAYFEESSRLRLVDVEAKTLVDIAGPSLSMSSYAMTRDSRRVFLLDEGLFEVDLKKKQANSVPIDFSPSALNLTPDDKSLVLRQDTQVLRVLDLATRELSDKIDLDRAEPLN